MSVLPFRLNFVTDRFNECTTIYSYKKMIKKKKLQETEIFVY
jgi:hypothetical protein